MFCKHIGAGHSAWYLRVYFCTLPALVSVPGPKEQDLTLTGVRGRNIPMLIVSVAALYLRPQDVLCLVLVCERRVPASVGIGFRKKLTFVQNSDKVHGM